MRIYYFVHVEYYRQCNAFQMANKRDLHQDFSENLHIDGFFSHVLVMRDSSDQSCGISLRWYELFANISKDIL